MSKDKIDTVVDRDGRVWTGEVTGTNGRPDTVDTLAEMILGVDAPQPEVTVRVNDVDHTGHSVNK